jgi:hypothetical protein
MTAEERTQRIYNVNAALMNVKTASSRAYRDWDRSCNIRKARREIETLEAYLRLARMALDTLTD